MDGTLYGLVAFFLLATAPLMLGALGFRLIRASERTQQPAMSHAFVGTVVPLALLGWVTLILFWALVGLP